MLDKDRAVVVYCYGSAGRASPKAALRTEAWGYRQVFDYQAGKVDWQEDGMPSEK